jgi:hypothetical protein
VENKKTEYNEFVGRHKDGQLRSEEAMGRAIHRHFAAAASISVHIMLSMTTTFTPGCCEHLYPLSILYLYFRVNYDVLRVIDASFLSLLM